MSSMIAAGPPHPVISLETIPLSFMQPDTYVQRFLDMQPDFSMQSDLRFQPDLCIQPYQGMQFDPRMLSCSLCSFSTQYKHSLKSHITSVHPLTVDKLYFCSTCGKDFTRKNCLHKHESSHSNWRPYWCENCYRTFKLPAGLKNHTCGGKVEKPYCCSFCNKRYVREYNLNMHERLEHSNQRSKKNVTVSQAPAPSGSPNR